MLVKFEQNRIVRTIQNLSFFWQKRVNHFWQGVDAILKDVYVTETIFSHLTIDLKTKIFRCSKNYRSPTRATRLKVAPNMADPISFNENRP